VDRARVWISGVGEARQNAGMALTLHTADVVVPSAAEGVEPIERGAVLVEGDRIVAIGEADELRASADAKGAKIREHRGALTAGLVNAHSHLQYTAFADLASLGVPFPTWLGLMVKRRSAMTAPQWAESARVGTHLAIASGTTAVADIVTDAAALGPIARSGLRGISYVEAVAADDATWARVPASSREPSGTRGAIARGVPDSAEVGGGEWESFAASTRAGVLRTLDGAPRERAVGVSPHTLYTLSRAVFEEMVAAGRARGQRIHTHLAESAAETDFVERGSGLLADMARHVGWDFALVRDGGVGHSPAREMDAWGGLGEDVHVAHGVHCSFDDRALLRERGTAVALCVRSNEILGAGTPPVAAYLDEGSPIAVGTDSSASSPSLDMWAELFALREVARAQGFDSGELSRLLVDAATRGGAFAMGLDDGVGELRVGGVADFAVFDVATSGPTKSSIFDSLISHGAGSCRATVIGGRLVHRA
jgi:aminodeoxyfutalosine deaminase